MIYVLIGLFRVIVYTLLFVFIGFISEYIYYCCKNNNKIKLLEFWKTKIKHKNNLEKIIDIGQFFITGVIIILFSILGILILHAIGGGLATQ